MNVRFMKNIKSWLSSDSSSILSSDSDTSIFFLPTPQFFLTTLFSYDFLKLLENKKDCYFSIPKETVILPPTFIYWDGYTTEIKHLLSKHRRSILALCFSIDHRDQ